MRRQPVLPVVVLWVVGVLLLAGCGVSNLRNATARPTAGTSISVVPSSIPAATRLLNQTAVECGWNATLRAWIDSNKNGQWDAGERPLAGVKFFGRELQSPGDYAFPVSDETGTVKVFLLLGGCPEFEIEVYAKAPEGYTQTTPLRIKSDRSKNSEELLFGFVKSQTPPAKGGTTGQIGATPLPTSQRPASAPTATDVPRSTPLPADPTSTLPQATVYTECGWTRMARAWEDRNANGQREGDESPLAGVTVVVSGTIDTRPYKFDAVTDAQGQALLTMVFVGCPIATAEVSTTTPPGYVSTTPSQFISDVRKYYTDETIQPGFKKK